MLAAPSPGWWSVFSAAKTMYLLKKFLLFGRSHCPHTLFQCWPQISICSPLCFTTLSILSTGKWGKAINPWIAVLCVVVLLCLQLILVANLPAGPQPHTICFLSSENALWHCLGHPGGSGAKGLQVYLLPLFLGDSGWGGLSTQGKMGCGSPWSSEVPGELCCLFYDEENSSIWSSLIPIKQIFLLQALCCLQSIHENYIQHVKVWYWSCYSYDWLCRSWFVNTFWRKTFIWIGTWIQIPWWQGCTVLTISIQSDFSHHIKNWCSVGAVSFFPGNLWS